MSLKRQLLWYACLVVLSLLVGVVLIAGHNLKNWIEKDSAQRALDTASALAQAVAPGLAAGDRVLVNSLVDGIFDSESYDELRISGHSLETDVVREGTLSAHGVPNWFANVVSLSPASAEVRLAGDGGRDHSIRIQLNSAGLHQRLWLTMLQLIALFAAGLLLWILLQSLSIKRFLQPVKAVGEQLRLIYRHQFTPSHIVNRYRELIPLVEATEEATMSTRGEIQSLSDQVLQLRSQLQVDPVTGLNNRTALELELSEESTSNVASSSNALLSEKGTVIVIELDDLREINIKHGSESADNLLADVAELIRSHVNTIAFGRVWRTGGGAFMCRTDLTTQADVETWCSDLVAKINDYAGQSAWVRPDLVAIGAVIYQAGKLLSDILAVAEDAVQLARQKTEQRFVIRDMQSLSKGHLELARDREGVLRQHMTVESLDLMYRPAILIDDEVKTFYEVTPWLPEESGTGLSSAELRYHAERAGLDVEYLSTSLALAGEVSRLNPGLALSLRVGPPPAFDAEIEHWLGLFRDNLKIVEGFGLQISESVFSQPMVEALALLRESLNAEGMRFRVDSVGRGGAAHAWLQKVKPDYIVIHPSFGRAMADTYGSLFYVTSLCGICERLDIEVLIDGIDDRRDWQQLKDTGVLGALGDYPGRARAGAPE